MGPPIERTTAESMGDEGARRAREADAQREAVHRQAGPGQAARPRVHESVSELRASRSRLVARVAFAVLGSSVLSPIPLARAVSPGVSAAPAAGPPQPGAAPSVPAALVLDWQAPPGCPQRDDVFGLVSSLARDDVVEWQRFERVLARVAEQSGRWQLELEFVRAGRVSRRRVESARCADLAQAAAVAIVLAHRVGDSADGWDDPGLQGPPEPHASAEPLAPAHEASDAAVSDGATTPLPSVARGAAEPIGLTLETRALLDPTTLGTAALGVGVGARVLFGPWSTGLYGALFPAVETPVNTGQAISLGLLAAGVQGCRRWAAGLDTCLGVELGQLRATPVGLEQPSSARDLWLVPNASLELSSQPLPALAITADAALLVPLVRGEFRVDEVGVHRIPALAARVGLGVRFTVLP